ncbi:MAG: undecaprenyl-diphosphatase [Acidobacteria bacterium]|nr:MAG: undecaprenyl-diphosphatase [Acidobacteriota bacterium]
MPALLNAALLGVVQGLTEFLPVSSTAHLLIGARLLGYHDPEGTFTVMIQAGSILAIMWLYRAKILDVLTGLTSKREAQRFALMIVLAVLPSLVLGALFSGFVKRVLYGSMPVIAVSFIVGGIVMLVVERIRGQPSFSELDSVPTGRAFGVGLWQTLALIPGVSRSGATIVGGLLLGLDRPTAAEFSFFLAMPTLIAAFAHDLLEVRNHLGAEQALDITVGFVMAFVAAALVVKPFVAFVRRSGFTLFAWYRIVAGVALLCAVYAGWS